MKRWTADGWEGESDSDARETTYKFSSTQVNLHGNATAARRIRELAAQIPEADLAADGREDQPHITVLYGLHGSDPDEVRAVLADEPPLTIRFGKTSHFADVEDGTADAVKVNIIDSPALHRLHKKIANALPHTDTHPDYKPHATIGYVKPGRGKKYDGDTSLDGLAITVDRIVFSNRHGEHITIPLGTEGTE